MPRRSAADIATLRVDGRPDPLPAPDDLSPAAQRIWTAITSSEPPEHFRPSDIPLLRSYAEACALADDASAHLAAEGAVVGGKASPWLVVQEKAVRAQNTLSVRLRLSPSARIDPKTKGRAPPVGGLPHERRLWDR